MVDAAGHTLFTTALGSCGIAWRGDVVVAACLPEQREAMVTRLLARVPDATGTEPPPAIRRAMDSVHALLSGARETLEDIAVDAGAPDAFSRAVYAMTRAIPPGKTRTYGELAVDLGDRALAQAVGQALGRNPIPIIIPCHRVVGAGGRMTGFSAPGGVSTKLKMLQIEGAIVSPAPSLFEALPLQMKPSRR